jgi:hypothetical protein
MLTIAAMSMPPAAADTADACASTAARSSASTRLEGVPGEGVPGADYAAAPDKSFEFGLQAIFDGLEARLAIPPAAAGRWPRRCYWSLMTANA